MKWWPYLRLLSEKFSGQELDMCIKALECKIEQSTQHIAGLDFTTEELLEELNMVSLVDKSLAEHYS